jgi:hypothetical protein
VAIAGIIVIALVAVAATAVVSSVLDAVTSLRITAMSARRAPDAQAPAEAALGHGVARLVAVAEKYPDLKANTEFLQLQHELVDTETRIQVARRIYNANVRTFDTLVQTFPSLLIARMFGFEPVPYFEVEPARSQLLVSRNPTPVEIAPLTVVAFAATVNWHAPGSKTTA